MASRNSGMKVPSRPAPGVPGNRRRPQNKPDTNDWPPDPFSPPRLKSDSSQEKRKAPPRPPPPKLNNNNSSNHFRSIFGSTKRNPKKGAATAIVKPLPPPASTPIIPTGTLIDLQTPPTSPKSQRRKAESIWSINSKTSSTFESGFEDDFGSMLSSGTTTPGTDLLSDLSPDKSEPYEIQPLKTIMAAAVTSRPTIICVPKAKPARPPPPQLDGSPPMPSMPPPPPPPDLLRVLSNGPELPPRPSFTYEPPDTSGLPKCTAMYDYASTHPDDLQFETGDIITVTGEEGSEWLRGILNGKEGIFPATYVSINNSSYKPQMKVIALFSYRPDSWDDLDLQEGDVVTVIDRVNHDWLYGEHAGKRGMFPECYVQDISYLSDEE